MIQLLLAVIYLSFISLGLPDSLLGAAWPSMYGGFGVPLSYAGAVSIIIAVGTVISSLLSDRLTRALGTGRVTGISVGMTAAALFGFSISGAFWQLCLFAIPYGLGAGSVDAALNNYVALHYKSRHMSWLHCMWGVGAALGPAIMGYALTGGQGWHAGYRGVALIQTGLAMIVLLSLPLWKRQSVGGEASSKPLTLPQILGIPGAKAVMLTFFCYCGLEATTGLWASSYLTLSCGFTPQAAASLAGMFYIGITVGRGLSGFLTMKLSDAQMVRLGCITMAAAVALLVVAKNPMASKLGLLLIGFGGAPIYPCLIHATPANFGKEHSQAVIGVQMASAYAGTCLMPPLFGFLSEWLSASFLPVYLMLLLAAMALSHEMLQRRASNRRS